MLELMVLLAVVAILVGRSRKVFPFMIIAAVAADPLVVGDATAFLTVPKMALVIMVVVLIIWHRINWPPVMAVGPCQLLLYMLMCASVGWSYFPEMSLMRVMTVVSLAILYLAVVLYCKSGQDVRVFWSGIVLYAIVDSCICVYRSVTGDLFVGDETGGRAAGITGNPNDTAYLAAIAFSIAAAAVAAPDSETPWYGKKAARMALTGLFVAAIAAAGSRSGFVCMVVGAISVLWSSGRIEKVRKKLRGDFLMLSAAALATGYIMITSLLGLKARFGSSMEDRLGGRMDINEFFIGRIKDSFFIGHGLNTSSSLSLANLEIEFTTHNTFINVLVEFGLLGLVLYGALAFSVFRTLRRFPKYDILTSVAMDGMILKALCLQSFVFSFAGDQLRSKMICMILALVDVVYGLLRRNPVADAPVPRSRRGWLVARRLPGVNESPDRQPQPSSK